MRAMATHGPDGTPDILEISIKDMEDTGIKEVLVVGELLAERLLRRLARRQTLVHRLLHPRVHRR